MTHLTRPFNLLVGAAVLVLAVLAMAVVKPAVSEAWIECSNTYLPAGDWTACGTPAEMVVIEAGINAGGGNHNDCAGAMVETGGKSTFPWGWKCGSGTIVTEWPGGVQDYAAMLNNSNAALSIWIKGY
jgi:hypothetical protein